MSVYLDDLHWVAAASPGVVLPGSGWGGTGGGSGPPPPPPPPPSGGGTGGGAASGIPMPCAAIPGWRPIFCDDFTTAIPSGAGVATAGDPAYFPGAVASTWRAYPWPWEGTPSWANYFPERVTSWHDSMMDIWVHTETISGIARHLITANEPNIGYLTAGRFVACFYVPSPFPDYHISWLLWPQWDDNGTLAWPEAGEIDFPEADTDDNSISAFIHRQGGTTGGDATGFNIGVPIYGGWHTAAIEWQSGTYCRFTLDDVLVGYSTDRIPISPMRWVIQQGGSFSTGVAPDSVNGHIYLDWVVVYVPA